MAKVSVHIPDELLCQARAHDESANVSQLVQSGLRALVGTERERAIYEDVPEDSAARLLQLKEHFLVDARADYRKGYEVAQTAALRMPLHALDSLARAGFDVERWITPFKRGYEYELIERMHAKRAAEEPGESETSTANGESLEYWGWLVDSSAALGNWADPIGFDEVSFTPSHARVRGYSDALREIWAELEEQSRNAEPAQEQG